MYIVIGAIFAFLMVLFLVSQGPDEETLEELKVKASEEPKTEHKSSLDPYVSEDNEEVKEKVRYKPRKIKVKALVEVEEKEDNIVKPKRKYKPRHKIL